MPRHKARPTTYKGILMRSRLEAAFAATLDEDLSAHAERHPGVRYGWQYEPQCFADETGQYLPDFVVTHNDDPVHYYEVKPCSILHDPVAWDDTLRRMEVIWSSDPEAVLAVAVGHGYPTWFSRAAYAHSAALGWDPDLPATEC